MSGALAVVVLAGCGDGSAQPSAGSAPLRSVTAQSPVRTDPPEPYLVPDDDGDGYVSDLDVVDARTTARGFTYLRASVEGYSATSSEVTLSWYTQGSCGDRLRIVLDESSTRVVVGLTAEPPPPDAPPAACTADITHIRQTITLDRPLGDRSITTAPATMNP